MEYYIGDIVEYKNNPGVELEVIEIYESPRCYLVSDGKILFDSHLILIKAYQPEDKDSIISNTGIIILMGIVVLLLLKR